MRILTYEECEAMKTGHGHQCDCGGADEEKHIVCDVYKYAKYHSQLRKIYGKYPIWSERLQRDRHFITYIRDDAEPSFGEYKKLVEQFGRTHYEQFAKSSVRAKLRKQYIVGHEEVSV